MSNTINNPANSGVSGRAQQPGQPASRQAGPIFSNKPLDNLLQIILPPVSDNLISGPVPANAGGPVSAQSGHIWPRLDYSENQQTPPGGAANFTAQQFSTFGAAYVSFAVPHTLLNRKLYCYANVIFPNVGAFGAIVFNINLIRNGKTLTSLPFSLYNNANNNTAALASVPFICGSSATASYDNIGLSLRNLAAGETSPVSLIPLICAINIDRISVDLDPVQSTATNISSLRIWVGCISY